jgi:hypothetical protein
MMTEMKTGIIWACRAFLRGGTKLKDISPPIPQHGYRSLDGYAPHGGLILHEFAHSVFEVVDANVTIGNSKVPMYGHKRSLLGVQQKGARSGRINADSYRMFATATYWNSTTGTPWSIDPNNIGTGELR